MAVKMLYVTQALGVFLVGRTCPSKGDLPELAICCVLGQEGMMTIVKGSRWRVRAFLRQRG